jgi:hypothetical protein
VAIIVHWRNEEVPVRRHQKRETSTVIGPEKHGASTPRNETSLSADVKDSGSFIGERIQIDETHEAEIFGPDHQIVTGLIELEIQQLIDLGDNEPDARAWLIDRTDTIWMALFAQGVPHTAEHVEGLIRLTGVERSDRMINDLAYLANTDTTKVKAAIANKLGIEHLQQFVDLTTLDITPAGAPTKDARFANLFRLVTMVIFVGVRCIQVHNVTVGVALVHPRVFKYLPLLGFPVTDLDYGVMDYQLSDSAKTPMPTQAIAVDFAASLKELTHGSDFMQAAGKVLERNGYALTR